MKIREIINEISTINGVIARDIELDLGVEDITNDSRNVRKNSVFVAIKGEEIDAHKFIEVAILKGAKVIVHSKELEQYDSGVCYIKVENDRKTLSEICRRYYHVDGELSFIGVTGTNGKTTTTTMIKKILEHAGHKVGLMGTVANYIGDIKIKAERTTPDAIELFKLIKEMKLQGCRYCIMEVSSHATVMGRIEGIEFISGAFTNLTQDHLDFHKTFEEYYKAKFKFMDIVDIPVVNVDDKYGRRMNEELLNSGLQTITYGINRAATYFAGDLNMTAIGSTFNLYIKDISYGKIQTSIPGKYNVYNILAAIASLVEDDIVTVEQAIVAMLNMESVDGRCERVYHDNLDTTVIVDYAHTPDGLKNILSTMKNVVKGRLITVFGCGGDRDATKRPLMAKEASKYSDFVIVTSDNPRFENPDEIISDILDGMSGEYKVVVDRGTAIEYAVSIAEKEDIVVIAGKGHEDYQIVGNEKHYFSDKEKVKQICNRLR